MSDILTIRPVTPANREAILALQVAESQRSFIESTAQCLAEADEDVRWHPVGLYHENLLVGFAMYGQFGEEHHVWLDRLLIDRAHQGKGYGRAALRSLIDRLLEEYRCTEIYLSIYEDNLLALSMYQRFGFAFNGTLDTKGEKIMVWRKPII